MSVSIRLSRVGSKKEARYRIVVSPTRSRRDGQALDILGSYFPLAPEATQITLDKKKFKQWVEQGAIASRTVSSLVKRAA